MEQGSKKTIIFIGILVVVAIIAYVGWSGSEKLVPASTGGTPKSATSTPTAPPISGELQFATDASKGLTPEQITQKKAEILKMVSTGKILTAEQKSTILSLIIGEQIKKYNFTDAERNKVIDALNKN